MSLIGIQLSAPVILAQDVALPELQEVVDCCELRKPEPLVNRCACGCGRAISANRLMTLACRDAALAKKREAKA